MTTTPNHRAPSPPSRRGLLAILVLLAGGLVSLGSAGPASGVQDPLLELRLWTQRFSRTARPLNAVEEQRLRVLLDAVRIVGDDHPERGPEIDLALLDLGIAHHEAPTLRALALEELARRIDRDPADETIRWLATDVLDQPKVHRRERRVLAAEALRGRHAPATLKPLLRTARDPDPAVRAAALGALVGWPDAAVHLYFLDRLDRDPSALPALREHLREVRGRLGPQALDRLRASIGRLYVSEDWRDAARARPLVAYLDPHRAVPILIESLTVWERRSAMGHGGRRIQKEILDRLQRISGRSLGLHPELWRRWWKAVREGRVALPGSEAEASGEYTTAPFFGLQLFSDRVIFVVDRSGSMESPLGTAGRSRFQEAVFQLFRFLESAGEETRFGIVVFNDRAVRWRKRLTPATSRNLGQARRWIEAKGPAGGTQLRAGIRRALDAKRGDDLDAEAIEADTLIVLCDGATGEGPAWVRPWLDRVNGEAQLVFHCVQIGPGGDGTLQTLAEATDGDFVRVDG